MLIALHIMRWIMQVNRKLRWKGGELCGISGMEYRTSYQRIEKRK